MISETAHKELMYRRKYDPEFVNKIEERIQSLKKDSKFVDDFITNVLDELLTFGECTLVKNVTNDNIVLINPTSVAVVIKP